MTNYDDETQENIKQHNRNWPWDHSYRMLIIGVFGSGKTNALLNLISHEADIDKIYIYAKDSIVAKCHLLINKCNSVGFQNCDDPKAFVNYVNNKDDIYQNID